jgi:cellulose synthase/poly-beta-1,6-N-acetylglucosamine synthase-like glycosyltransferase
MSVETLLRWVVVACFGYLVLVNLAYLALALAGLRENRDRRRESGAEDYDTLARSRFTIPVSVVLAAFNEESAICATVRSLLRLDYPELEVIVVDDGSTDETLARLVREFELAPYEVFPRRIVETAAVRAVYRSAVYPNLRVVEKENGGKADALNAGLNYARYRYVCGVDADTVFAPDALLKGMRLAMTDPGRVIGVTSHLTIALDPERTMAEPPGRRRVDRRPFVAYQHLDYLRAFFNNRLAWSRYGFMLCAVGAFQLWRRDVLEEVGGYARGFTCEDIELTFRVHEHYRREGRDYAILCLPDNVGTTEGPDTVRKLVSQRERWQRVIDESVWHYRRMLGNPRYGSVGVVGTPFYLLSEVLAPVFEVLALVSLPLALAVGAFDWVVFALVLVMVAFANGALTGLAILSDDLHSRLYRLRDVARLLLLAPLDLFLYRPILMWSRLKGTWRFLRRDKGWYKFERNVRGAGA